MKKTPNRFVVIVACLILSGAAAYYRAQTVPDLTATTNAFLASLTPEQLAKVKFPFNSDERQNWYFVPRDRNGLTFKELQPHQERLAFAMTAAALGQKGFQKAATIMSLEDILRQIESGGRGGPAPGGAAPGAPAGAPQARGGRGGGFNRDPELHYISIFGEPSNTGTWGWRLEGHHISVNITMDKGKFLASTPTFLGSNPAEVRDGPRKGLRALAPEEDLARRLLEALDANQKKTAILAGAAPNDIITGNQRKAEIGAPTGLSASAMNAKQKEMLLALIQEYVDRNAAEAASAAMNNIRKGINQTTFTWIGSEKRGDAHYYRIQSPDFLIEYDNTQNQANHIHSVYRDLKHDWGIDLLAEHYRQAHTLTASR